MTPDSTAVPPTPAASGDGGHRRPPSTRRRALSLAVLTVAVALLAGSIVSLVTRRHHAHAAAPAASATTAALTADPALVPTTPAIDPLARMIAGYQQRLRTQPADWQTWGNLGLAYVQQARVTVNPMYYPKAAGVLAKSLALNPHGNFIALAGRGALEAARHNFAAALHDTRAASRIDPYNVSILGALADAQTQLGRYGAAQHTITRMMAVRPGTPAFARLSYAEELAGNLPAARQAMQGALQDASTPSDRAFACYYLGELAYNHGRPALALGYYRAGLRDDPADTASLEGRAKAEAALGRRTAALRDFTAVVNRVPQPQYVLEFGDYLQSLGRPAAARAQYATFTTELRLFRANGVRTDLEPAQFYADHGDARTALRYARAGVRTRPFLEVQDALAWALHRAGHDHAALRAEHQAMRPGMRNALLYYHAGMIERSLHNNVAAVHDLRTALVICPYFNPLQAPAARRALHQLDRAR